MMIVRRIQDPKGTVDYLLELGGGFGGAQTQASEDHWPQATWAPYNEGRDYGVMVACMLGPKTVLPTDIANLDGVGANVIKLRRSDT